MACEAFGRNGKSAGWEPVAEFQEGNVEREPGDQRREAE